MTVLLCHWKQGYHGIYLLQNKKFSSKQQRGGTMQRGRMGRATRNPSHRRLDYDGFRLCLYPSYREQTKGLFLFKPMHHRSCQILTVYIAFNGHAATCTTTSTKVKLAKNSCTSSRGTGFATPSQTFLQCLRLMAMSNQRKTFRAGNTKIRARFCILHAKHFMVIFGLGRTEN